MTKLAAWKTACATFVLCAATAIAAPAQTFHTLAIFDGTNGNVPSAPLVQGPDGNLFTAVSSGGANDWGTIIRVTSHGQLTKLYDFCSQPNCSDGILPVAGLILTNTGGFYGTTYAGGANNDGTIFKINRAGVLTTLHSFGPTGGLNPFSELIQATDGNLYGITRSGGGCPICDLICCGTIFRITLAGSLTTLSSFSAANGSDPEAPLVQGIDGDLYGTTIQGGSNSGCSTSGCGTVYKLSPQGLVAIYNFCQQTSCADGAQPDAGLVQGADGNFYGTTVHGGTDSIDCYAGCGTAFRITPDGILTTLYSFGSTDGSFPGGTLIQGTDGNFYGTTFSGGDLTCLASNDGGGGCGTVFKITPAGVLTTLHNFELNEGVHPKGALVQGTDGNFYGTADQGGDLTCNGPYGCGTIFRLGTGLDPFVAFVHNSGRVGQTGGILGQGFTGTTSVLLNGTPASFTVASDTFLKATVPAGATTGYVTVTTPSGTLTSNVPFHVVQ